ncbi:tRNA1(Val) (adenine(37)-N6)-methyltransferase [Rheinheimera sp.]|uniref:tRNA1(Val) (adenine(37)-N6)-methyltransferase n=1 Tax=Rheinheimera sp. TaxID=1869214 RepID=UPI0027BA4102|nr:methyltransferase [Rheinheimera sp.]
MSAGFRCKQFYVDHDACAMKVGTDALLLGAWAEVPQKGAILDIGCGSGILSLMLAQRTLPSVILDAVELDSAAATQAKSNVSQSLWANRIRVIERDILTYPDSCDHLDHRRYQLIISNPPFFAAALVSKDQQRAKARHTDSLSFAALLATAALLLADDGLFSLILPCEAAEQLLQLALASGWCLQRRTLVSTLPGKMPIRTLLTLSRSNQLIAPTPTSPVDAQNTNEDTLVIHQADGGYSEQYRWLLRDFYLKF